MNSRVTPPPLPSAKPVVHRYLSPTDIRALRDLEFHPRRMTHGMFSGRHASPQRGQSSEFSDYREYTPGDEMKNLDWKVLGRSDRLYIKTFEHQAQMDVYLLVDASASMEYGRKGAVSAGRLLRKHPEAPDHGKIDYACRLAAAIAWLVTRQQDRAGLGIAQRGLLDFLPARGTTPHVFELVDRLDQLHPMHGSGLALALRDLALRLRRRAVILIFSDLMDDGEDEILLELRKARHRGHTLGLFHVLHPHELDLPDFGEVLLTDSEKTSREIRFHAPDIREAYAERIAAYLHRWHEGALSLGVDHLLAPTHRPAPDLLREFLTSHGRRS
ncbi:MAG: DUF58 domain-containing protein [Verrucomicrobia bacterium]|nr:DUF58 domain-containing protein [Verrucomicrobiota bacterium]MCH8513265.1 DUF58 domain-containing protein [Kiritimatiellia bacterium]